MTFGERLTQLRKENGYDTRNEFADKLGIPSTTLRNYETDVREPGHTFLKQISEFFNVSVDYLLCLTDDKEILKSFRLRTSEQTIIEKYRDLDDFGRETVNMVLDRETERVEQIRTLQELQGTKPNFRAIQYYQKLASAGTGQVIFGDVPVDRIEIPDIPEYKRVSYAIGVNGNSMEPLFYDGDMLLIEPTCEVEVGEIGIFIVGNEAFVKKLGENELISLNKGYNNIPLNETAKCMGRVIDKL